MNSQPIRFGERLQQALDNLHPPRNQAWLAEVARLERSTISRLIRGERNPTLETVQAIAPFLGASVEELLKGTDAEARVVQEAVAAQRTWEVRREDYEAVIQKLVEYEGRLNDFERKARAAQEAREQEEQGRRKAVLELQETKLQVERLERALRQETERVHALEEDLRRHREALNKAVGEVSSLRAKLQAMAEEMKSNSRSSRAAAILAGIAALAGVVTAATYLGEEEQTPDDERDTSTRGEMS